MKKFLVTLWITGSFGASLFAQDALRFFELVTPKYKVQNSLYKTIDFIDSRQDSSAIGTVNVGLLKNREAKFVLKSPFRPQLQKLVDSLTDTKGLDGELLFQLKTFRFIETTGSRYCYLGAALYAKDRSRYKKLSVLDTLIIVTTPTIDKVLQKVGNDILSDFIAKGLTRQANDTLNYNISDIKNIDSVEKRQIPLYNIAAYVDGIYVSYASFSNQVPDRQATVKVKKDGSISSIKILDGSGKEVKMKSKDIYAVVHEGQPYIATEFGYYPLFKIHDNFFFSGDVRIVASSGDIAGGQFALGLIGNALARRGNQETFDMIIDHLTGDFIHLRAIIKDPLQ